ncbi:hypothetical protein BLNAU_19605 [Blattamonas nauphoetae]|uniref:Uncharacterized protein n=1 Tax=Blattamonas nauphoetae TaxID=2049346 RepID=A0ABQ9X4A4_9EUKA|nr:hypothetical protein BLNAU_19605 [Blattamonas nauphoetae]
MILTFIIPLLFARYQYSPAKFDNIQLDQLVGQRYTPYPNILASDFVMNTCTNAPADTHSFKHYSKSIAEDTLLQEGDVIGRYTTNIFGLRVWKWIGYYQGENSKQQKILVEYASYDNNRVQNYTICPSKCDIKPTELYRMVV